MTDPHITRLARRLWAIEQKHDALARARQLPASSVLLPSGETAWVGDAVEAATDATKSLGVLDSQVAGIGGLTDTGAENASVVPGWITSAADTGSAAFDAGAIAYDRARTAKAEAEAAVAEAQQALTDAATALYEAGLARSDAAAAIVDAQTAIAQAGDAITAANAAVVAAEAAQTAADGKSTVVRSTSAATGAGSYQQGDQWWQFSGANIVGLWLHDGSAWVAQELTNAIIATLDAGKITTGTLAADRIGALSITTAKLAAGAITTEKLAALAVTANELAANAVTAVKIAANAVTAEKILAGAVTTDKLDALAVTAVKIAAGAIVAEKIAAGAITTAKLAADAIDGMTITGALIRTAATGQRLQLDTGGLKAYNGSDQLVGTLASSGDGIALFGPPPGGGFAGASATLRANDTASSLTLQTKQASGDPGQNAALSAGWHKSIGSSLTLQAGANMSATIKASENGSGYREMRFSAGVDATMRFEADEVEIDAMDLTHNNNPVTSVVTQTTLTAAIGTTVAGTSVITKDSLGLVQFNVIGTRTVWTTGGTTTIGTFPAGCRPSATVTVPVVVYGAGTPYLSFAQVTAGGVFILYNSPTNGQSWTVALVGMLKAA